MLEIVLSVFEFFKKSKIAESDDGVSRKLILIHLVLFLMTINTYLAV